MLSRSKASSSGERRDKIRLRCGIRLNLGTSKGLQDALVVNVSSTGLCVEMDAQVKPKAKVKLHKSQFGAALSGYVAWCRPATSGPHRYQVGVIYEANEEMLGKSWVVPALEALGYSWEDDSEKRKLARIPGRLGCFIHCFDNNMHFPGTIVDLSLEGALVEGQWPLPMGEEIRFATDSLADLAPLKGVATVVNQHCVEESPPKWRSGLSFRKGNTALTLKYVNALKAARGS